MVEINSKVEIVEIKSKLRNKGLCVCGVNNEVVLICNFRLVFKCGFTVSIRTVYIALRGLYLSHKQGSFHRYPRLLIALEKFLNGLSIFIDDSIDSHIKTRRRISKMTVK